MNAERLPRFMAFLERDPTNPNLLADAAEAAFDAGQIPLAASLMERLEATGDIAGSASNLKALIALAQARYDDACAHIERLIENGQDTPQLRFNLAFAYMMLERHDDANRLLDDDAIAASPRGPTLKIQALHHLERYDDALAIGERLAEDHPDDEALMGALATLAMDADQIDLAKSYATQAGSSVQGLSAKGLFALDEQDPISALSLFEQSLLQAPEDARSLVGKGLALMSLGDQRAAAEAIERGAARFEDHLGSWIAAGWARFLAGDLRQAREAFDRVVAIDPTFSEGHGGIAVLDVVAGQRDSAEQNSKLALRLDRSSMGGALSHSLLLEMSGDNAAADIVRSRAMAVPVGPRGETLADLLSRRGSHLMRQ